MAKIHDDDLVDLNNNYQLIYNDMEYASHINTKYIIINFKIEMYNDLILFSKLIRSYITKFPTMQIYIIFDLDMGDSLRFWNQIISLCGYPQNVGVILRIQPDLPKEVSQYIEIT